MNINQVKELRNRLSIPLNIAMDLIKEYDDISICENEFHRNNINTICRLAECSEKKAKKYYEIFQFDIDKSIQKINEQLVVLAVLPNEKIDKIGFSLWAENESIIKYKTSRDRNIFIQTKDFDIVVETFKSVVSSNNYFDSCGRNYFDNEASRIALEKIARIKTKDVNTELFLRQLIKWFNDKLRYADYIVISGNL
ncbi:hypothetical protein Fleli_1103 [Bernardetia litoralis DSM 6794]|uniref:Uncharacterized protein n=1 Tax=Bernardetia litoralis (strain ATCC 23117 / DSM 6794 / NBRC 15988 / NCIMB 1366 / Fx l1 / Sio-4) TaxID=880071 RepID=I4AHV6_BERLS|nr:hypothetical protein [Bernardetia litoralis]AFM03541.1 hypothetical protein Fleli_1103 [Bernardetia litoralis DSM 6794]